MRNQKWNNSSQKYELNIIIICRIYAGSVRMPNMEVYNIKDVNLSISDFETTKDIFFDVKG